MSNLEKYQNAFVESFEINIADVCNASKDTIAVWDSIGTMSLIAVLEESFGIEFNTDDILEFNDYESGLALLKKYGVEF